MLRRKKEKIVKKIEIRDQIVVVDKRRREQERDGLIRAGAEETCANVLAFSVMGLFWISRKRTGEEPRGSRLFLHR
jgi:hypothetical protein